jgi:hypothetical protein
VPEPVKWDVTVSKPEQLSVKDLMVFITYKEMYFYENKDTEQAFSDANKFVDKFLQMKGSN